jgi:TadE-like protein
MRWRHHPGSRTVTEPFGRRRTRGQALVEFALVIPLFLLLIFGIVDAGRLIYAYNTVANSARNSARVAIVNQSTTGTDTCDTMDATVYAVGCAISSGIGLGITAPDVSVEYRDPTDAAACVTPLTNPPVIPMGCVAVVEVTGHFQALTPVIGQLIGAVDVTSTSKMPVERTCANPPPAPLVTC